MKLAIFLSTLLLFLPIAIGETKIFSGNVLTGTDKVIDEGTFRFTYDEQSNKVFVQTPAGGLIVENGACKPNAVFRVCINRANFSHKNITTYVYYYEVNADIYKLTGSLSATSKATPDTLLQGELSELAITISNPTDFEITGIAFNYDIINFTVIEAKGCELGGSKLAWQGSLQSKYDRTCTARIIAEKEGAYSLAGNLSYFNGFEAENKTTDTLKIKVLPKQLKASYLIDKGIEVKSPFYVNISLHNIHSSENIEASATIKLPAHVSLLKDIPAFSKEAKVLKRRSTLKPGDILNYSLYMEALSEGKEPIDYRIDYTIKGISDALENKTFILIPADAELPASEAKISQEPANNIIINKTAADAIQTSQAMDSNKTIEAEIEPENKTAAIIAEKPMPKSMVKWILIFVAAAFAAFLAVLFIVNRIQKSKPEIKLEKEEIKQIEQLQAKPGQPTLEKAEQAPQQEAPKQPKAKKKSK